MKKQLLFTKFLFLSIIINAQISIVQDINPGVADGITESGIGLNNRIGANDNLYFSASDGINGFEVWKTDGTSSGTQLLHNIMPPDGNNIGTSLGSSFPWEYYVSNNYIFFSATRYNNIVNTRSNGNEMYRLDLNDDSLIPLPSVNAFMGGGVPLDVFPREYVRLGNELFFTASVTGGTQSQLFLDELCSFSGNDFGSFPFSGGQWGLEVLVEDIYASNNFASTPEDLTEFNGKIYFSANDGTNGRELWVSDGTEAGTFMLHDINGGPGSSNPSDLIVFDNRLYFIAENPTFGRELWSTDGTSTGLILKETSVFGTGGNVSELVFSPTEQALYFAYNDPVLGQEVGVLYVLGQGILFQRDLNVGSGDSNPANLFPLPSGGILCTADNGVDGRELYHVRTDGTSVQLKNINTQQITIIQEGSSDPEGFIEYGGDIYFSADDGINGRQLWVTDLTSSGTRTVGLINTTGGEGSGANSANPRDFVVSGNTLFFTAETDTQGSELWKYINPTLSNSQDEDSAQFSLYPNPSDTVVRIKGLQNAELNVTIFDIAGKEVYSNSNYVNDSPLDIGYLNNGVYLVKVEANDRVENLRLIKN